MPGTYLVEAVDCGGGGNGGVKAVSDVLDVTPSSLPLRTVVVLPADDEAFLSSTALLVLAAASAAGWWNNRFDVRVDGRSHR